jgi:maltose phosphorylase
MNKYIQTDEWKLIQNNYCKEHNEIVESLCSIGNGHMGQRANFEEDFTGNSLQGSYVGGVYYPDKTRVGWWKNGYPEYFAKVLNSVNWIGIRVDIDGESVDMAQSEVLSFQRILDMKCGVLQREVSLRLKNNKVIKLSSERFVSMDDEETGAIKYKITLLSGDARINVESYLDADVSNKDANYNERFWNYEDACADNEIQYVASTTKKTGFTVSAAAKTFVAANGENLECTLKVKQNMFTSQIFSSKLLEGNTLEINKIVVLASSRNYKKENLKAHTTQKVSEFSIDTYEVLKTLHINTWANIWKWCDVKIEGDIQAQQGIRFNIFQLLQTYTGKDSRLNIGPKGFTGEKYGGSTYWDTEAYCLPFYMSTAGTEVAKNLLIYRYNHLEKAIENAVKLGFKDGAALYPMVTMNGEECHNEWEITFEEIHRNGAIAYAIYDYVRYTGDEKHLAEYGLEVLIGICRFWAQRVNWSQPKSAYVILGVTGPNEYENNVNNNWYTNFIAKWCLDYTLKVMEIVRNDYYDRFKYITEKTSFQQAEVEKWSDIIEKMFLPEDEKNGIYLQQEGYLDKEQITVDQLPESERPLNQKWSWDRILRSCFIKQADVLQGLYFFEDQFETEVIKRNFDFYEPRTVHESSLSPCVHVILATKTGNMPKAYEMYLRTSRLDLDNYNNDTEDGLHITSMAGTWLSVIKGFGGMRIKDGKLSFDPSIPSDWKSLSFNIHFRQNKISVSIDSKLIKIMNVSGPEIEIFVKSTKFTTSPEKEVSVEIDKTVLS